MKTPTVASSADLSPCPSHLSPHNVESSTKVDQTMALAPAPPAKSSSPPSSPTSPPRKPPMTTPSIALPPPVNHVFVDFENVHEVDFSIIGAKAVSMTLLLGARQTKLDAALV